MKERLLDFICCPACKGGLELKAVKKSGDETIEGSLVCGCGEVYPIINSIPRLLKGFDAATARAQARTQKSFGYQWTKFSQMSCDFRENFLNYAYPLDENFFKGKTGLDAGCGFGRHIYNAAKFGAEMIGLDFSAAIESSYENTKGMPNVHLVQGDIYNPPFKPGVFDFVYSIGVLHHLPNPQKGFKSLAPCARKGGQIFIWVYSSKRRFLMTILESLRGLTSRIPFYMLKNICFMAALFEWIFFIIPYKALSKNKFTARFLAARIFSRIKMYSCYPFQVSYADWFDRLSAPIRFYYNDRQIEKWFREAGLKNVRISETGSYGLRSIGEKI